MDEGAFVLFLGLRELLVFFEDVAFVGVFFLNGRNGDFFFDHFVDDDVAVVVHRRPQTAQRRDGDDVVVGATAASRWCGDQRCAVVEFFFSPSIRLAVTDR